MLTLCDSGVATMPTEKLHDRVLTGTPSDLIERRTAEGWRIAAIEWERESTAPEYQSRKLEPVPFGYRVANDCAHLEWDQVELETLSLVTEMIVQERPLAVIAESLNEKGFRTRDGSSWTPAAVFRLMPRIVDSGPRIFENPNWPARRVATRP